MQKSSGRGRQTEWEDLEDRARQPVGPEGVGRRSPGRSSSGGRRQPVQGHSRGKSGGRRPGRTAELGPSRFIAVLVLVVVAVIVVIGGIAATTGGAGSGVSISILPFPQNTDTTITQ